MKKKIILGFAILLPLFPIVEWVHSIVADISTLSQVEEAYLHLSMVGVYYPARIFALLGFTFMFYQFILTAKLPILETEFKRPTLIKNHRSLGKLGFVLMLLHGLFMVLFDVIEQGTVSFSFEEMLGLTALFLLTIGVIAAWHSKALDFKLKTWKKFHIAAYFVFPLSFIHAILIGTVVGTFGPTHVLYSLYFVIYLYLAFVKVRTVLKENREAEIKAVAAQMIAQQK